MSLMVELPLNLAMLFSTTPAPSTTWVRPTRLVHQLSPATTPPPALPDSSPVSLGSELSMTPAPATARSTLSLCTGMPVLTTVMPPTRLRSSFNTSRTLFHMFRASTPTPRFGSTSSAPTLLLTRTHKPMPIS